MNKKHTIISTILIIGFSVLCYSIGRTTVSTQSDVLNIESKKDTVYLVDTIYYNPNEIMLTPHLDSISTRRIMEDALFLNHINFEKCTQGDIIYQRHDMEYLPYYFLTFSSSTIPSKTVEKRIYDYIVMCTARIDDKTLFEIGRQAVEKLNKRIEARPEKVIPEPGGYTRYYKQYPIPYYESFSTNNAKAYQEVFFTPSKIDTLRVKVIAHNDRRALGQLEKYYKEIGYDLGIAIYYKVLLCRDGNGDLAERLYRVLKPYFGERPELKNAAHDALVRAAICDHDQRAKELCDSLGYSLCDYKVR